MPEKTFSLMEARVQPVNTLIVMVIVCDIRVTTLFFFFFRMIRIT